jgi:hypothetical protein
MRSRFACSRAEAGAADNRPVTSPLVLPDAWLGAAPPVVDVNVMARIGIDIELRQQCLTPSLQTFGLVTLLKHPPTASRSPGWLRMRTFAVSGRR